MVKDGDLLAVFNSIHRVLKAEKELKARGLPILLIPAPRSISADCGLAIRYAPEERLLVEKAMAESDLLPVEIYVKRGEEYVKMQGLGTGG